jgi:hypothetical protein
MKQPYCPVCGDPVAEVRIDPDRIQLEPCGHAVTDTRFWERAQRWLQATEPEEVEVEPEEDAGSDDPVGEHQQWNQDPRE